MTSLPARQLPTESQNPTTPFSEPLLSNLRRGMGWVSGRPILMAGFTMTPMLSRQIQARLLTFRQQITGGPQDRQAIGIELAKLLAAFPTQDQGDTPAGMKIAAYSDALGGAPEWAVREARLKVVRGDVAGINKNFAPTPPVFADVVKEILRPYRSDLADLEALSKVEPTFDPSPEERARVADGFGKLKAELPSGQARAAKSDMALAKLAEENLRTTLRGLSKSPEEIDEVMNSLRDAPARPDGFTRPTR